MQELFKISKDFDLQSSNIDVKAIVRAFQSKLHMNKTDSTDKFKDIVHKLRPNKDLAFSQRKDPEVNNPIKNESENLINKEV